MPGSRLVTLLSNVGKRISLQKWIGLNGPGLHRNTNLWLIAALAFLLCSCVCPLAGAQSVPLGVNLEFVNDYQSSLMFVDVMRQGRPFAPLASVGDSGGAPVDSNGWPTADCGTVLFDGATYVNYSGTYHLSFNGQATIGLLLGTLANQTYTAATNTTTLDVTLGAADHNLTLYFTNTRRTAASATNTGFTNLKCIRPGYAATTTQTFTTVFTSALAPFSVLRFMDALDTNNFNGSSTSPYYTLDDTVWADRRLPTDASQAFTSVKPKTRGMSWELVIQLCNETSKDPLDQHSHFGYR